MIAASAGAIISPIMGGGIADIAEKEQGVIKQWKQRLFASIAEAY